VLTEKRGEKIKRGVGERVGQSGGVQVVMLIEKIKPHRRFKKRRQKEGSDKPEEGKKFDRYLLSALRTEGSYIVTRGGGN